VTAPSQDTSADEGRLPPGTHFGAYEIVRTLGAGAFGTVYEAIRHPLGNRFALKVLHPELTTSGKIVARFMREAEATVKIRHPHVVSTFEVGVVDRAPFLAMEFLEGETLRARMRRSAPMPLALVADLLVPVCSAVAAVHDHDIVHRDLKPDNIMITEPRSGVLHPIVLDFGVARALSQDSLQLTTAARAIGTPLYMSPEQLLDPDTVDARSDQWALGVILYACLSGALPFDAKSLPELMVKVASAAPVPLGSRIAGLPAAVVGLVERALQRDRAHRFASAREIGAALLPFASLSVRASWAAEFAPYRDLVEPAAPPPATAATPTVSAPAPPSRRRTVVAAVGGGLVALVVAASVAATVRSPQPPPTPFALPVAPLPPPTPVAAPDATAVEVAVAHAVVVDGGAPEDVAPIRRAQRPRVVSRAAPDASTVVLGANGAVMR